MMTRTLFLLALVAGFAAGTASTKKFVGTWKAVYDGKTYCVLQWKDEGGLSGTLRIGEITADPEGRVNGVDQEAGKERKVSGIRVEGDKVLFREQTDGYEFTVTGEREGKLVVEGMPIQPFPMMKE